MARVGDGTSKARKASKGGGQEEMRGGDWFCRANHNNNFDKRSHCFPHLVKLGKDLIGWAAEVVGDGLQHDRSRLRLDPVLKLSELFDPHLRECVGQASPDLNRDRNGKRVPPKGKAGRGRFASWWWRWWRRMGA